MENTMMEHRNIRPVAWAKSKTQLPVFCSFFQNIEIYEKGLAEMDTAFVPDQIAKQATLVLKELVEIGHLGQGSLVVIGASTSEVAGKKIGTAGQIDIGAELYAGLTEVSRELGLHLAFQCCEHLNRALVVERHVLRQFHLTEVAAVPIPGAGGSMAATAYNKMDNPCLAESIQADAGIDIGETMIGMHLRPVAVPIRTSLRSIGHARVNAAWTRPKLIGGARAQYAQAETSGKSDGSISSVSSNSASSSSS